MVHLEVGKYRCTVCNYIGTTEKYLKNHIKSQHEEKLSLSAPLSCNMCLFETKYKASLNRHQDAVHLNKRIFDCEECDYKASTKGHLKRHREQMHLGIKYPCEFCGYKAADKYNLNKHINAIHRGVKYSCNNCDFQSGFKESISAHKRKWHKPRS